MKTLNFGSRDPHLFHTLKEHDLKATKQLINGKAKITGFTQEDINVGDRLNIVGCLYTIDKVIERRDHKGELTDQVMNKNSFFEVETNFERIIAQKE
jgi:hypothetical protein